MSEEKNYNETLNLPKTDFPMRGNLPENEPKIQAEKFTQELYETAKWMSNYYIASIGEVIFSMIPSGKRETGTAGFGLEEDFSLELTMEMMPLSGKTATDPIR